MNTSLVLSPHPLMPAHDREIRAAAIFYPGETLTGYLNRTGLAKRMGQRHFVCTINGTRLPRELWHRVRPKPGAFINLQAVVGKGGKNPIATILSISLMVFAPQLGAALASSLGLGTATLFGISASTLLGGAISLVGGIAINALFPPPKAPTMSLASGVAMAESPTYSLNGGQNRARPFEPMPVIMGTHRVFADLGAQPYTEYVGQDQYLYQIFDFGYNDVDLSAFQIGNTAIEDFTDITTEVSDGSGAIKLFPGNVDTVAGGTLGPWAAGVPGDYITKTSSPNATQLAVEFTGSLFAVDGSTGDVVTNESVVDIEYSVHGAGVWNPFVGASSNVRLSNASRTPLRLTYLLAVASGQYDVRVRPNSTTIGTGYVSDIAWSQLRTYQPDTADYTGRKRVGVKIKATGQLSGTIDQFSALVSAKTTTWSGSPSAWLASQATSNPAWWFLVAARGYYSSDGKLRWGAGLDDTRIDLEGLKAFGAWCDSKTLTFNAVFDQQLSVYDMLSQIALCGRGTVSWGNGKLGVVWDAPAQPVVAVFGMSNIEKGSFEISYATQTLADEVILSFINPAINWQRDTVRVTAPGVTSPVTSRSIELFGCTDVDMAGRAANLYAATNVYRTRKYKWVSDYDGMIASRGDVVQLSHDLASYDYSGRFVEGGSNSTLKLDRNVPLFPGGSWILIVKPDGSYATYAVPGGSGDVNSLPMGSPSALGFDPWADANHPPYDYRWLYGATATPGRLVKIDQMRPLDESHVEVTAIDENALFYASETSNPYTHVAPRQLFGGTPQVNNFALIENGVRAGTGYAVQCTLTWDVPNGSLFADVNVGINGEPMKQLAAEMRGTSFSFIVKDGSDIEAQVVVYGTLGKLGGVATASLSQTVNFAALFPPSDVSTFSLDGMRFSWTPVTDVDVVGYRIRSYFGNDSSWDAASPVNDGLITETPWTAPSLPQGLTHFLIKAVDAAGLESVNAAVLTKDLGDLELDNVLVNYDMHALGWPGTITNGSEIGSPDQLLADALLAMWNANANVLMWDNFSSPSPLMWGMPSYASMVYEITLDVQDQYVGDRLVLGYDIDGDPYKIEWRNNSPDPMWFESEDSDPIWTPIVLSPDDDLMWGPIPDYQPWLGEIIAADTRYDFRITTGAGNTQGAIRSLVISLDVPDLTEGVGNIAISAGGTRLPISLSYLSIVAVTLTLQDDGGSARTARWVDKDVTLGPLVKCYDDAVPPNSVAGHVDAVIKGY